MTKILMIALLTFGFCGAQQGENVRKITLTTAGGQATAILDDSAAARSFAALLPLTLHLSDYAGHEKVATLSARPGDVVLCPSDVKHRHGERGHEVGRQLLAVRA